MKTFLTVLFTLISSFSLLAQPADVEMADAFRAEGKIYIVVAVILIILIGLFFYLIRLDKKLTKLERTTDKNHGE